MTTRGRRPKGEYSEKKRVFASRVREDTWAKLQQAAARSGRSVSQEFEHRLRRGLDEDETIESTWGDPKTLAMMRLAAQAVQSLGNVQNAKVHWTADVDLFDAALEAITGTLRVFRPHALTAVGITTGSPRLGTPTVGIIREAQVADPAPTGLATGSPRLGTPTLGIIREAQAADPARPLNKSTKRQRAMTRLKEDLGEELTARAVRFAEAVDGTTTTSLTTGSPILGTPTLRINSETQAADPPRALMAKRRRFARKSP
jgi:hypothetical protein